MKLRGFWGTADRQEEERLDPRSASPAFKNQDRIIRKLEIRRRETLADCERSIRRSEITVLRGKNTAGIPES
jgi:hypothetical protein